MSSRSAPRPRRLENRGSPDGGIASREQGRERRAPLRRHRLELRPRSVRRQAAQCGKERRVGELLAAELHALAVSTRMPDSAALASSASMCRVFPIPASAGEQDEPRAPGAGLRQHMVERRDDVLAPDDRLARHPRAHRPAGYLPPRYSRATVCAAGLALPP